MDPRRARPASSAAARSTPRRLASSPRSISHGRPARPNTQARSLDNLSSTTGDLRRLAAGLLSAVIPGLGQALNRRYRLARWLALPFLVLAVITAVILISQSPTLLLARIVAPSTMTALLIVNALVLAWRLFAVLHAFFDRSLRRRPGRVGLVGLAALVVAVGAPHALGHVWGASAKSAFERVFAADPAAESPVVQANAPGLDERINILMIGIDKTPTRSATLTDTLVVVSMDPVGKSISMLSLPRDLVDIPLGNGEKYVAKLNSLYGFADRRPDVFPQGGIRALEDAVGALLGIEIHYYALLDFAAFVKTVDALGGVDLDVPRGFSDPSYDGYGFASKSHGYTIEPGPHHFDGVEALAYVRSRKAEGETDFTRAARQQLIILALRDKALEGGTLLLQVPTLLDSIGEYVRTDIGSRRLPELAAIVDEIPREAIVRVVLQRPYVKGGVDERGSIQRPVLDLINELSGQLFTEPGVLPALLASPVPSADPPSSGSPAASP